MTIYIKYDAHNKFVEYPRSPTRYIYVCVYMRVPMAFPANNSQSQYLYSS